MTRRVSTRSRFCYHDADQIRRRGDIDPEIVKTTMAENFLKEFGDAPSTMPLQAMFVSGQRPATVG